MAAQRILIVEDEKDIADLIRFNVEQAGFQAVNLAEGRHLVAEVKRFHPDIILLDLMLPDVNGLDLCKRLKKDSSLSSIPVLMVTAKGTEGDRIAGLELGADDYLVKPFSPRELILRIKAILSRAYPERKADPETLMAGPIELNPQRHSVTVDGSSVELTATEFRLLTDLMSHPGRVRTREILLDRVWGYSFEGYGRTVDTHIRRLRKKLGNAADLIDTVRGVGYRFKEYT